ncbi:MAG: OsmC family peroxiredoxin [Pyrinomonadaceae bacterium]
MSERKATAEWKGGLKDGKGKIAVGSGLFEGPFSFSTRFEDEPGTNPEELLGASLAGCYAMALNAALEKSGTPASSVRAEAGVFLGKDDAGFKINRIELTTIADVPGLSAEKFDQVAEEVKKTCPISKALAATEIKLKASLGKSSATA